MKKLFFVAPFDPLFASNSRYFAANKKITFILRILSDIGFDIVLISSFPQSGNTKAFSIESYIYELGNGKSIDVVVSKFAIWPKLDYFFRLLFYKKVINFSIKKFGNPVVVWIYNAYSFEMLCLKYLKNYLSIFSVLEFEDWHFSRGVTLKSLIDWVTWRNNISSIDFTVCVNVFLSNISKDHKIPCFILPGIIEAINHKQKTISNTARESIFCGYFGGLTKDKGMIFLLNLINAAIKENYNITWIITGAGPFSKDFNELKMNFPQKVVFYGKVEEAKLAKIISSVDILLNPHIPNKGVFPFKILEYISYEKLVFSSILDFPESLSYFRDSIVINPINEQMWLQQILQFNTLKLKYKSKILICKEKVLFEYSREAIKMKFQSILNEQLR